MSRPYRGHGPEARKAERSERLVDAGVELLGTGGVAAVTMRAVCRQAELSQKFFYESFTDTEDLLREVYRSTMQRAIDVMDAAAVGASGQAAKTRASVDAAARLVKEDPRVCRILFMEPVADLRLRRFVRETIVAMISHIVGWAAEPEGDPADALMHYATVFGAVIALFVEWTDGTFGDDRDAFVDHVTGVLHASPLSPPMPRSGSA